jgi:hypothetical protein
MVEDSGKGCGSKAHGPYSRFQLGIRLSRERGVLGPQSDTTVLEMVVMISARVANITEPSVESRKDVLALGSI